MSKGSNKNNQKDKEKDGDDSNQYYSE